MVSFEASRSARGVGIPLETVLERMDLVPALVRALVSSRVGEGGETGVRALGAIWEISRVEVNVDWMDWTPLSDSGKQ
jgi:hypothetical protein